MRLSWGQGAIAALVLAVAAVMVELPSRVLAPVRELRAPINLPQSRSPEVVLATPLVRATPVPHHSAPSAAPRPVAQLAAPQLPAVDVASRPTPRSSRPTPAAPAPPLDATLGRARHLPLPTDEARPPPPPPPPSPAPAPPPVAAPVAPPVATPAPAAPAETTPSQSAPAPSDCPAASRSGHGHEQDHDHTPNGKACGYDK
jgi:hypothetical protein